MTDALARVAVFIYFKASAADDAKVLASMRTHRDTLLADGIEVSFWRRNDPDPAGAATWMETYAVGDRPLASLQSHIAASAIASGLLEHAQGPRHVERFERIDP